MKNHSFGLAEKAIPWDLPFTGNSLLHPGKQANRSKGAIRGGWLNVDNKWVE